MNSNDFIYSDDIAESLGSRTESDEHVAESGEPTASSAKGLAALGSLGFAVLSVIEFLEHPTRL